MRHQRLSAVEGPNRIIRWQGARLVLDHVTHAGDHDAFAFATNASKGTRS